MNTDEWEARLRGWSKPLGVNEDERCENAERMVRDAIKEHGELATKSPRIFSKGSFKNNTNISRESDVDVCVLYTDTFYYDTSSAPGFDLTSQGVTPATYEYAKFKSDVVQALKKKFGPDGAIRGNKAIFVPQNSYRVDADVVPVFPYREYFYDELNRPIFREGTAFVSDEGKFIVNYPDQHLQFGRERNLETGKRFKFMSRCLKSLRCEMHDKGIAASEPMVSFLG